ncbi:MAG TPA: class I SAM-dependent methyltransferase [Acidimicrobiales bacterium]|jgi:SAM-dependent methyltransferase|nr:class I SAM-dependent methyltransferase [Acidimicrobiales bacterium]
MKPFSTAKVNTEPNERAMREYWDARARENAMYFIHSTLDYAHTDQAEFWASGLDNLDRTLEPFSRTIEPTDRVIEIGCGIGRLTKAIADRAAHVLGVDVSSEMIDRAREALAGVENVEFAVGNGRDLSGVADASMDVAYSFIVFQHIPDPQITCRYIEEIGRVLRPGGWTVFQVSELPEIHRRETWTDRDTLKARLGRLFGSRPRGCLEPQWLGSAVSREDLTDALTRGGLVLDATLGDGSQFCMVNAHRPPS